MNVLHFSPIKISLASESKIKDFLFLFLEDSSKKSISISPFDDDNWVKLCFSLGRRKLARSLNFFLISSSGMATLLSKKLDQNVEKIDTNRLLYDLFFYCQQKEKGVVFLGFDEREQSAIKKNFSFGEKNKEKSFSLSLYFLSKFQLRTYGGENVRVFFKKMKPKLVICNDVIFFSQFGRVLFDIFQESNFIFFLIDKKTKRYLTAKHAKKSRLSLLISFFKFLLFPFFFLRIVFSWPFKLVSILIFYVTLSRVGRSDQKYDFVD